MSLDPTDQTEPDPVRESILNHPSPQARLVCLYLDRVPGADEGNLRQDLGIDQKTLAPVLQSLLDRGLVEKSEELYTLAPEQNA